ncbi:MAG TPA: pirin-like C-terminal cupin domain-containing protein, partial [Zeimonas sp.]|nr:pirin-like C-terminal cupin domain-containing protein [Zeimonas sp.]
FQLHAVLQAGAKLDLPAGYGERAAYVVAGRVESAGRELVPGQMQVFGSAGEPVLQAREASTVLLLGGEPLGERHIWWNFVSSRKDRIEQAKADWKAGRIALPPNDAGEFIPLPEDRR